MTESVSKTVNYGQSYRIRQLQLAWQLQAEGAKAKDCSWTITSKRLELKLWSLLSYLEQFQSLMCSIEDTLNTFIIN